MSKIPDGTKCEITPEQAYSGKTPEIPEGFEYVRFAFPNPGEMYITKYGCPPVRAFPEREHAPAGPRIIVREKPIKERWIVEAIPQFAPRNGQVLMGASIRELKPITRKEIGFAMDVARMRVHAEAEDCPKTWFWYTLRELGIEVEE